ncbi:MAG: hypothetical protein KQH63_09545 [Desulfobulbaceae bacterium]|nr:hypothetical protein [Desulfobulbaceae bacterium]
MRFQKLVFTLFFLTCFSIWQSVALADCSCSVNSSLQFGVEFAASTCPPEGASDSTGYTYTDYRILCSGSHIYRFPYPAVSSQTPSILGGTFASSGYKVLRNPAGTHFIMVFSWYNGTVAGVDTSSVPAGSIYTSETLNEYCAPIPSGMTDNDGDKFPTCLDCNDDDPALSYGCPPPLQKDKNLGRQCKANTLFGNPINVATGNKYHEEKDFVLTGPSPDISLSLPCHYADTITVNQAKSALSAMAGLSRMA